MVSGKKGLLCYFLSCILFILIATEVFARRYNLAPPLSDQYRYTVADSHLPYRLRPYIRYVSTSASGEFTFEYKHNRRGFRDIERSASKPPGTYRILAVGDSFTYGEGAPFEKTYPYLLETTIQKRSTIQPKIEVINLGVYRFFPEAERILLQQDGLKLDPDLVLVELTTNDLVDTYLGIDAVKVDQSGYLLTSDAKKLGKSGTWLYVHSHPARLLLSRYVNWKIKNSSPISWEEVYEAGGEYEDSWRKIEWEYSTMIALARKNGFQIVFFYLPGDLTQNHSKIINRFKKFLGKYEIHFFDLTPDMLAGSRNAMLYWPKDGHCTPEGYQVMTESIYGHLNSLKLIP